MSLNTQLISFHFDPYMDFKKRHTHDLVRVVHNWQFKLKYEFPSPGGEMANIIFVPDGNGYYLLLCSTKLQAGCFAGSRLSLL